jgi:hypothetical protein
VLEDPVKEIPIPVPVGAGVEVEAAGLSNEKLLLFDSSFVPKTVEAAGEGDGAWKENPPGVAEL